LASIYDDPVPGIITTGDKHLKISKYKRNYKYKASFILLN